MQFQPNKIISNNSVYGVVWSGKYRQKNCVLKLVVLSSGRTDAKYFRENDKPPFLHSEFTDKKTMSVENFMYEAQAYSTLADLGLAPTVYNVKVIRKYPIHYGQIISERLDCSVKDILLTRRLKSFEKRKIKCIIRKLHESGIAHGDMKPSNIGVYLEDGFIDKCYFFDCQKVRYSHHYDKEIFAVFIQRDLANYKKHYLMNRAEAKRRV
jgi:serine/threonine protein kinase